MNASRKANNRAPSKRNTILLRLVLVLLLIPLWVYLRTVYRDRIGAFGCFDDCNNIMGGYFLLAGKRMFTGIFFNHMPSMAYISAAIQAITRPGSIYMLIFEHRMFMIYLSLIADVLLTLRFGFAGFGFALLFESTKGFIFGDRFLAEPIIVYPVVYLWGLVWNLMRKKRISPLEVWISVNLTWFVIFSREPYIPLILFLFGSILWYFRRTVWVWWGSGLLALMSLATIVYFGAGDLFFNVFTVNQHNISIEASQVAAQNGGTMSVVLYPLQVFFEGTWNLFHGIELGLMILLFICGSYLVLKTKKIVPVVLFFVALTLANVRTIIPGSLYYGTFHHIQWYALVIFTVCLVISRLWEVRTMRWASFVGAVCFLGLSVYAIVSPYSFLHEHVDRQTEFTTNYNQYYVIGEVVRLLSGPGDSLFLDGQDDLIYWQAKRYSDYPYGWYTSLMPYFPVYTSARTRMLASRPPAFFYALCHGKTNEVTSLPSEYNSLYVRLNHNGTPSCLYVRTDKASRIRKDQWASVEQFNYSLPAALKS